jgi:hypothetical protein
MVIGFSDVRRTGMVWWRNERNRSINFTGRDLRLKVDVGSWHASPVKLIKLQNIVGSHYGIASKFGTFFMLLAPRIFVWSSYASHHTYHGREFIYVYFQGSTISQSHASLKLLRNC